MQISKKNACSDEWAVEDTIQLYDQRAEMSNINVLAKIFMRPKGPFILFSAKARLP